MKFVTWIVTLVIITFVSVLLGIGTSSRFFGLLIDDRNKMSLSRFQTVLWTILILSSLLTAALTNLRDLLTHPIDALSINFPPELLALMGISFTSLAASQLILSAKDNSVDRNDTPHAANWDDMFKGDDAKNANYLDLGKVQMLYITIILVFVYGVAIAILFMKVDSFTTFPPLSATMVTLLGISHAGYLTYKAVPRPPDGKAVTLAVDGKAVTLAVDGKAVTLAVDGKAVTFAVDGKTVTLAVDGKAVTFAVDGKAVTLVADGKAVTFAVDGKTVTLAVDGKTI
jgi:hypothetical protein